MSEPVVGAGACTDPNNRALPTNHEDGTWLRILVCAVIEPLRGLFVEFGGRGVESQRVRAAQRNPVHSVAGKGRCPASGCLESRMAAPLGSSATSTHSTRSLL